MSVVTRGKVSVGSQRVSLRDVLLPGENQISSEGPADWMLKWSSLDLIGKWNRERELGLDRRETG